MRKLLLSSILLLAGPGALAETDPASGLTIAPGWELTYANCAPCHSTRLVTQNRLSRAGWLSTIRWMQEKHNLWPLGDHEEVILDYLEANYSARGSTRERRRNLNVGMKDG